MDIVFRYFAVIAAGISAANWVAAERRLRSAKIDLSPDRAALALKVARTFYGSMVVGFLLLAILQWAGGYADPLFPLYDRTTTISSTAAWALFGILWTIHLIGIWRPGVAEAALQLGLFRGPTVSPRMFRLITTVGLLVNMTVFAALLAGLWGPIRRPAF